jgi:chromate transporter
VVEVATAFLALGVSSFGGPIAHLGYFRREFVERRGWLDDAHFAQLLALCQFLPGPASSQLGFALGLLRAGWAGALAAFVAFTLPSALLLFVFATLSDRLGGVVGHAVVHGLKLVAVAVVAQAVVTMARTLAPDVPRAAIALAAAAVVLAVDSAWAPLLIVMLAALLGPWLCRRVSATRGESFALPYGRRTGAGLLLLFGVLLVLAIVLAPHLSPLGQVAGAFYRAGALVFGGGHVVLPMLQQAVVEPGWVDRETFLAGYGAAQAVPGPMFSLAAFLGERLHGGEGGAAGAATGLLAIFLPGLLLVAGALPFWRALGARDGAARSLAGVNAAVVGVLAAALYDPVWVGAVHGGADIAIAVAAFALLAVVRWSALAVVGFCVAATVLGAAVTGGPG